MNLTPNITHGHSSMSTRSAKGQSTSKVPPATPRLSASLIVVNEKNEVLLVQRNTTTTSFAGMHVFPGGNFDKAQDTSMEVTAIRETFEETGVLLASPEASSLLSSPELDDDALVSARKAIHARQLDFPTFLAKYGLKPHTEALLPFTQWITPTNVPRRFHTYFFVAFLPAASNSRSSTHPSVSRSAQHRLPTWDGGIEVLSARFIHPSDALTACDSHQIALMPPQYYLLYTLGHPRPPNAMEFSGYQYEGVLSTRKNTLQQQEQVRRLADGAFGRLVINPHPLDQTALLKEENGREGEERITAFLYEGDEMRGGPTGRLHRSVMRIGKGGVIQGITLHRNFDIFTEIDEKASTPPIHKSLL